MVIVCDERVRARINKRSTNLLVAHDLGTEKCQRLASHVVNQANSSGSKLQRDAAQSVGAQIAFYASEKTAKS